MSELPKRMLGRTGLQVTTQWNYAEHRGDQRSRDEAAEKVLNAVLDAGINFIDTSIDYGRSEELIGRFIAHRRSEYFLASKCGCVPGQLWVLSISTPPTTFVLAWSRACGE
jgi:aryl-alcohol dehydrogenase-like predicted oxidoreductase